MTNVIYGWQLEAKYNYEAGFKFLYKCSSSEVNLMRKWHWHFVEVKGEARNNKLINIEADQVTWGGRLLKDSGQHLYDEDSSRISA